MNRLDKSNYPYSILHKDISFHHSHSNDPNLHNGSESSFPYIEIQESKTAGVKSERKEPLSFFKRIIVVDDDPDITLTFKVGLEEYYDNGNNRMFEVHTYNSPLVALGQFKPHYYDLLLIDINMPEMNGFELSQKILELDISVRVCFISAAELKIEALREVYPNVSFGCFMRKPVSIEYLVRRVLAELD